MWSSRQLWNKSCKSEKISPENTQHMEHGPCSLQLYCGWGGFTTFYLCFIPTYKSYFHRLALHINSSDIWHQSKYISQGKGRESQITIESKIHEYWKLGNNRLLNKIPFKKQTFVYTNSYIFFWKNRPQLSNINLFQIKVEVFPTIVFFLQFVWITLVFLWFKIPLWNCQAQIFNVSNQILTNNTNLQPVLVLQKQIGLFGQEQSWTIYQNSRINDKLPHVYNAIRYMYD